MHAFDGQTDRRRTDRETKFSSLDRVCIPCIAVRTFYVLYCYHVFTFLAFLFSQRFINKKNDAYMCIGRQMTPIDYSQSRCMNLQVPDFGWKPVVLEFGNIGI